MDQIVAITGTKGKTSLVRLLEHALRKLDENVLRVDTSGAFYNQKLRFSDDDSRRIWGYAATNAPGRFLALHENRAGVSLLECTLFSARTGLAYKAHDVGVFLNVYEDHIGSFSNIQTKEDIANMKSFVFTKVKSGGTAVYNADDELVCKQLPKLPKKAKKIAVSALSPVVEGADYTVSYQKDMVSIDDNNERVLHTINTDTLPWFDGDFAPSVYLLLFTVAVLFALCEENEFKQAAEALQTYEFDTDGGRMVKISLENGALVILDYAHEKISLRAIASHAKKLTDPKGKVIGVLRLAPSRATELVRDTAEWIHADFDGYVIYDKVDGYFRKPRTVKGYKTKNEHVGAMASLFADSLRSAGAHEVHRILREDQALEKAVNLSCKGDVIVYIVGDDSARSRQFVKQFEAKEEV